MTVKLQNGNVITKDGKVSCSCCPTPEPQECCMYPAQALYDGDYSVDDLPDAIVATNSRGSHVLTKDGYGGGVSGFEPIISGAIYGNNDPAEDETVVTLQESGEGVAWVYGSGLGGGENPCLITEIEPIIGGVEDQFADTYTVTIINPSDYAGTHVVTRRSLCAWSTEVEESGEIGGVVLRYNDDLIVAGVGYTWVIESDVFWIKDGFANAPTGNYDGGNATVS